MKTRGFTLIEMLVAVMILTLSVTALLSVSAGSAQSVRYSKNKIIATWLAQQTLDTIRNGRDTAMINNSDPTTSDWWTNWVTSYLGTPGTQTRLGYQNGTVCFSPNGCTIAPTDILSGSYVSDTAWDSNPAQECPTTCPVLKYIPARKEFLYVGKMGNTVSASGGFIIKTQVNGGTFYSPDALTITTTVSWVDGASTRSISQSIMLTNWQL